MIDTKALRQKILDLAMRGKLVPQDPNDEPVENLLARIKEERHRLEKEKKISKVVDSDIFWSDDDNCYYENNEILNFLQTKLPVGWKYVRLGQYVQKVTDYVASGSFASLNENVKYYKEPNYAILVKTQDFQTNFRFGLTYTDKKGYEFLENSNLFGGELILSNIGSIGKVFIVPKLDVPMSLAPNSIMIRFYSDNQIKWFYYLFSSTYGFELLDSISSGTTMRKFNKTDLKSLIVPIPPLQEQQRIAAKLDELFALIDKIEKEQEELEEYKKLAKEKILELAVTGKLVKQDPNDEPASVFLERIKKEKEILIKTGKIKKDKADSEPLSDDDKNYYENLPFNWKEVSLKMICSVKGGKRIPAGEKFSVEPTNHKYLRVTDMKNSTIVGCAYISDDIYSKIKSYTISADDIYITVAGTIGSVGIIPNEFNEANLTENADKLLLNPLICKEWFINLLQSEVIQKQIRDSITKVGQPKLAIKRIEELRIPLPPVNEQIRINQAIKILLLSL